MKKRSLHILTPGPTHDAGELAKSHLASARLRLFPAAKAASDLGYLVTCGADIARDVSVVIVGKAMAQYTYYWLKELASSKARGALVVTDYTDHHIIANSPLASFYAQSLELSDAIVVPSGYLRNSLSAADCAATSIFVVEDPLEFAIRRPGIRDAEHSRTGALWFGHGSNFEFLLEYLSRWPDSAPTQLHVVSSPEVKLALSTGSIRCPRPLDIYFHEWNPKKIIEVAEIASVSIIPSNLNSHKVFASSNRLITSLALGLPTAATVLPSYEEFLDFFTSIDSSSIDSLFETPHEMNEKIYKFQEEYRQRFHISTAVSNWRATLESITQS